MRQSCMAQTPFDRGTVGRNVWGAGIVENVKWMIRRWGAGDRYSEN